MDVIDPPLPPPTPDLTLAERDMIMPLDESQFIEVAELPGTLVRVTDVEKLSGGRIGAIHIKLAEGAQTHGSPWHFHEWDCQVAYVVKGWGIFEFEGIGQVRIEAGTFMYQPALNRHREVQISPDFEAIEITLPAHVKHTLIRHDEKTGEWIRQSGFAEDRPAAAGSLEVA